MKVVVAIDSFKGSLSSYEAGLAIQEGVKKAYEGKSEIPKIVVKPLADGGEGTVEAYVHGLGGEIRKVKVHGPLMQPVICSYGYLPSSNTAVIEMAQAAGITLLGVEELNPLKTTTYGVGEVIRHAIESGIRKFIIGIGGSATNDCGIGMLKALGYEFYDERNETIGMGGAQLNKIAAIDTKNCLPELKECRFQVACDVTNPLCGTLGASAVFGPQKGATPEMVQMLDLGCKKFAQVVKETFGVDHRNTSGAGAAGGLGYAFLSFLDAKLESGIQIIMKETKLYEELKDADVVITGEGKLDRQTAMGKAPSGVAHLAKEYNPLVTVIALAGWISDESRACLDAGIDAYFAVGNHPMELKEAMDPEVTRKNLMDTSEQIFRFFSRRLIRAKP